MTTSTIGTQLAQIVHSAKAKLMLLSDQEATAKSKPEKWSKKELLGHLVDSASNNHQRFVRKELQDNLIFPGYQQEAWVKHQRYQAAEWAGLIDLWAAYNLHLARIIDAIPNQVRFKKHQEHSLDKIAWKTIPTGEATSLEYFIWDYVGHLEHHLNQILPTYEKQLAPYKNDLF